MIRCCDVTSMCPVINDCGICPDMVKRGTSKSGYNRLCNNSDVNHPTEWKRIQQLHASGVLRDENVDGESEATVQSTLTG